MRSYENQESDDYMGRKWAANIHTSPDGRFLYASNRGHESLAVFSIAPKTGQLTLFGYQPVNSKTPVTSPLTLRVVLGWRPTTIRITSLFLNGINEPVN